MTKVKICGVTSLDDARAIAAAGADMIGFNFYSRSPRYIKPEDAQPICDTLREELGDDVPVLVGVFVNELVSNISAITNQVGLDAAQLSGDESDSMFKELYGIAYKSVQPMNRTMALEDVKYYRPYFPDNEKLPSLMLDAYHPSLKGGTGREASEDVARAVRDEVPRLMLAGGLTPENVMARVNAVAPWGVDVASGVEPNDSTGNKDMDKVKAFIKAVREA